MMGGAHHGRHVPIFHMEWLHHHSILSPGHATMILILEASCTHPSQAWHRLPLLFLTCISSESRPHDKAVACCTADVPPANRQVFRSVHRSLQDANHSLQTWHSKSRRVRPQNLAICRASTSIFDTIYGLSLASTWPDWFPLCSY